MHHGDGSPGANVFVKMRGVEAFHAEITARNYGFLRPGLQIQPWGRTLELTDPFGNRLQLTEDMPKDT